MDNLCEPPKAASRIVNGQIEDIFVKIVVEFAFIRFLIVLLQFSYQISMN